MDSNTNLIPLDPQPQEQQIPLDASQPVPPAPAVASSRAQKAELGLLSVTGQGMPQIYQTILDGNEDSFRTQAADQIDKLQAAQRQKNLSEMSVAKGGMLSFEDVTNSGFKPTNPDTVIEQAYGHQYVNQLRDTAAQLGSDILHDADFDDPDKVAAYFDKGSDVLALREYALKRAQDLEAAVQDNSYHIPFFKTPWTEDGTIDVGNKAHPILGILNTLTGIPDEIYMRGNTPNVSSISGLEANNVRQQAQEILRQPFEQGKQLFDEGLARVQKYSPAAAQQWAASIAGMSTDEMITRDAMSAINITATSTTLRSAADLLAAAGRKQVSRLGRPGTPPTTPSGAPTGGPPLLPAPDSPAVNAARAAVEDVLNTTPANPTKANIAESMGDTQTAAVQKAIQTFTVPNPAKEATDTLMDMHRQTQVLVAQNPGNLSRELHTRLIDDGQNFDKNVVDLLLNTSKVNTLPNLLEQGFAGIAEKASEYFRGRESTLSNIEVRYNTVSNTYDHVFQITNYDGNRWSSPVLAANHAAMNGYGEARVVGQDPETIYLPPTAVLKNNYLDTFQTEKGSTYTMRGNTTERTKFDGTKHPVSEHTGYITEEEYNAYRAAKKAGKVTGENLTDGQLRLFTDHENGVFIQARNEPKEGLMPVEILPKGQIHFGHKITKFSEGHEVVPNPDFEIREHSNGSTTFHLTDKDVDTQVVPSVKPQTGWIPWNLKTKKYGNPVTPVQATIVPQGLGYHLEWTIPFDESRDVVTQARIGDRTRSATSGIHNDDGKFSSLVNAVLGPLRLPNDTLSLAENENRVKVVYTKNKILAALRKDMGYVEGIYKGALKEDGRLITRKADQYLGNITGRNTTVWNDFKRMLQVSQKYPDPDTKLPGYFFKTPAEIQSAWQDTLGRPASFAEQQAYLAYSRLNMADYIFRNIAEYRNKSRLGVMEHSLQATQDGKTQVSEPFEGRFRTSAPSVSEAVVVHEPDGTMYMFASRNSDTRQEFNKSFDHTDEKTGKFIKGTGEWKNIQVYDPDKGILKFKDVSGNPIRITHVLTKAVVSKPISWKQVPYRGGGHWDYGYDRYFKQPIMQRQIIGGKTQWVYKGDRTFSPAFDSHAESQQFLDKLNNVRELLSQRRVKEAKIAHLAYSDMEWKDFVKGFFAKKGELPTFNLQEPFRIVPTGSTVLDIDKEFRQKYEGSAKYKRQGEFIDGTRQGSLARNFITEYTGQRDSYDLLAPQNVGTVHKPFYKFQPAELTDPVVAMTRALDRIVNSLFGDDYKWSSMMDWLAENHDLLNATPREVMGNPFWHFMDTPMKSRDKWSIRGIIARSNQYKIRKLLGTPTSTDKVLQTVKQTMADYIYENASEGVVGKAKNAVIIPAEWTLHNIGRPAQFITGMAFHSILGLWNWTQIAAQQVAYANFAALSPGHALPGMSGAWMHLWSMVNAKPAILKGLGKKLEGINGWKPGEWEEARQHYMNTGFDKIGKTMSFDSRQRNFLIGGLGRVLNAGTIFFDLAEANVRHGAWYTAFHEFKRAYPNTKIGMAEEGMILRRANDLYMNMGRDSRTIMSEGVFRIPLQFFKYIENQSQNFLSKRIGDVFGKKNTVGFRMTQRARMYLVFALFFGPAGATGLGLLPYGDIVRKKAIENGYVPGAHVASTLALEGPLSYAGALASGFWRTGHLDAEKGTFYNFNDRYGTNGLQIVRDLMEPSSTYWKILLGAGGSTFANYASSLSGVTNAVYSAYMDTKDNPWPIMQSDWEALARNINSYRYAERMVFALEYGKWIDRHGQSIQDVGKVDAVFRTLTGMQDVKIDDMYVMHQSEEDRKQMYSTAEREYNEQRRLAEQYAAQGDIDNADTFSKRASFSLTSRNIPADVAAGIFSRYATANKDLIDKVRDSYYLKKVPVDKQKAATEAYQELYKQEH